MALDSNLGNDNSDPGETNKERTGAALFADSALYELHQSAFGLAQTVGLQEAVGKMEEPKEADSFIGRNLQMLGRGVGGLLPTVGLAIGARFAVGRAMERTGMSAEGVLSKRSVIGLNAVESGATGFASGALLKPTDDAKANSWTSFVQDRAFGGVSGGLSFAALSMTSLGLNKLASAEAARAFKLDKVLGNAFVSGTASGALGGAINVELNSVLSEGKVNTNWDSIGKSMYEQGVIGGLMGFGASKLASQKAPADQNIRPVEVGIAGSANPARLTDFAAPTDLKVSGEVVPQLAGARIGDSSHRVEAVQPELLPSPPLRPPSLVSAASTPHLAELITRFESSPATVQSLIGVLGHSESALRDVADFIGKSSDKNASLVESLVRISDNPAVFTRNFLRTAADLTQFVDKNSETFAKIVDTTANWHVSQLSDLAEYVAEDPKSRLSLLEFAANGEAPEQWLNAPALRKIESVAGRINLGFTTTKAVVSSSNFGANEIGEVDDFLAIHSSDQARSLARMWFHNNLVGDYSDAGKLAPLETISSRLELDDATTKRLLGAKESYSAVEHYRGFLNGDSPDAVPLLKRIIAVDAPETYDSMAFQLPSISRISSQLGFDSKPFEKLLALHAERGVSFQSLEAALNQRPNGLRELERFTEDPDLVKVPLGDGYVWRGALAIHGLKDYLGDDVKTLADSFNSGGLRYQAPRLYEYISEDPESRGPLLREMLEAGAGPKTYTADWLYGLAKLRKQFSADSDSLGYLSKNTDIGIKGVADFIDVRPYQNKPLIEQMVKDGAPAQSFNAQRLFSYRLLADNLGENSTTLKKLVELEPHGAVLPEVSLFVNQGSSNSAVLKALLASGIGAEHLNYRWLNGFNLLRTSLGKESGVLDKAITLNPAEVDFDAMGRFISNEYHKMPGTTEDRQSFVRRMIEDAKPGLNLDEYYLTGRYALEHSFGSGDKRLEQLMAQVEDGKVSFSDIGQSVNESDDVQYIARLIDGGADAAQLKQPVLEEIMRLMRSLSADDETAQRVLVLQRQGLNTSALSVSMQYLNSDYAKVMSNLIRRGLTVDQLSGNKLSPPELLKSLVGPASAISRRMSEMQDSGVDVGDLLNFVGSAPDKRIPLLESQISDDSNLGHVYVRRLEALETLVDTFGKESPVVSKLLQLEHKGLSLSLLPQFWTDAGQVSQDKLAFLVQELDKTDNPENLSYRRLSAKYALHKYFEDDSPISKHLYELEGKGLSISQLAAFIRQDPASNKSIVEKFVAAGAGVEELATDRLYSYARFSKVLGRDSDEMNALLRLERDGLKLSFLHKYFPDDDNARRNQALKELVLEGQSPRDLAISKIANRELLDVISAKFENSAHVSTFLKGMSREGAIGSKLLNYLDEKPDRIGVVSGLINSGAGFKRINDQIDLQVFPEQTASSLANAAENGGMSVARILGNLRDWQAGRHFLALVTEQERQNKSLKEADMNTLMEEARNLAKSKPS